MECTRAKWNNRTAALVQIGEGGRMVVCEKKGSGMSVRCPMIVLAPKIHSRFLTAQVGKCPGKCAQQMPLGQLPKVPHTA